MDSELTKDKSSFCVKDENPGSFCANPTGDALYLVNPKVRSM